MSKSITEKDFARKLSEAFDGREWKPVIDLVAELTGHEFAPEKPEPGTWHFTENGSPARVNWDGSLHAYYPDGEFDVRHDDSEWPALTPARVVSEADLSAAEKYRDALATERDQWKAAARAEADEVDRLAPAKPVELSEEEVGECHDSTPESSGYGWLEWTKPSRECFTATVNAALAKHGHGRVEVTRELPTLGAIYEAIDDVTQMEHDAIDRSSRAVFALLYGSK